MPVSKGIYSIWKDNSFVIISRKGDFVDLLCEDFVMMTPNHIHRSQLVFFLKINIVYNRLILFLYLQHIFHTFTFFEFITVHIKGI